MAFFLGVEKATIAGTNVQSCCHSRVPKDVMMRACENRTKSEAFKLKKQPVAFVDIVRTDPALALVRVWANV